MKKILSTLLVAVLGLALSACSGSGRSETGNTVSQPVQNSEQPSALSSEPLTQSASPEPQLSEEGTAQTDDSNILIAYFTWADNTVVEDENAAIESALNHYSNMGDNGDYSVDAVASASVVAPGNAAQLANWIQQEVGGDLHSIVVAESYPSIYDDCLDRASQEKADNARPVLTTHVENMEDYDIVFLGFPNWWYTLPMPVLSFVEEYDWSGKTVIPFVTHGTGGLSATVRDLTAALPEDATVLDPIGVYRLDIPHAQSDIQSWITELGLDVK